MRRSIAVNLAALALCLPVAALAQSPAPPVDRLFSSSAEVQAQAAKAKAALTAGQTTAVQPILSLAPYAANVEYRIGPGASAIHETEAEFFVVIDGSGVMQTGGTVVESRRTGPHDVLGTRLEGATARKIAKGDVLVVPQGTPHWVSQVDSVLIMISLHVPRETAPAAK